MLCFQLVGRHVARTMKSVFLKSAITAPFIVRTKFAPKLNVTEEAPPKTILSRDNAAKQVSPSTTWLDASSETSSSATATVPTESQQKGQVEESVSSRFSTTTKLETESITLISPAEIGGLLAEDSTVKQKADFVRKSPRRLPKAFSEARPNYLERLRWIFITLPLLGALWGALPSAQFLLSVQLVVTVTIAYIAGCATALLPRVPPLLGMMGAGAVLANFDLVAIPSEIPGKLRSVALAIILLRAGIGLDLTILQKLSMACIRLTFIPCFAEAFMVMFVGHYLLDLPFLWALLLGFVLAAVSPAVIVPAMIELNQQRLGTDKGIPTLIMAAASFDDVAAITGFGVVSGMLFQAMVEDSVLWTLLSVPSEAILGLICGVLLGFVIAYGLPANRNIESKMFDLLCALYIVLSGIAGILISNRFGLGGVGPLVAIASSATAAVIWKRQASILCDANDVVQIVSCSLVLKYLWIMSEPVLFAMIGLEFRVSSLDPNVILLGCLTLIICLSVRIGVTYLAVSCSSLTPKERLFVSIAWLPKATVQAALAPTALDMVRSLKNEGQPVEESALVYGETVLTVSILAIIITAPIGALSIALSAPRLLRKGQQKFLVNVKEEMPLKAIARAAEDLPV
ncbi:sodium/hydrogen exchanger 9B2-like isoform X4 [Varroa destructor]|uniref:Cation/H+ exchanger transmembrane domain-containing protein n=1 Tax=Varroa destructor TaxID=109461 RepID=A0A7M7KEX2_VARDE|nr:sodium/hydrogen exchanger 9B2-like isoform X4 [Varroa destructor]